MHGRLRARPGAVVARWRPGRLQRQAARARHAALRADHGGRRSGASRRWPTRGSAGSSTARRRSRPDNEFILGESEVRGFCVAAGFCAHGIAGAGGIGRQVASWIVDGEPELDLWKMDIRRFGAAYRSQVVHARPLDRELRDLLRHPLPERGAPGRAAAADVADLRRARWRLGRGRSARSPAGSDRTGSSRTRRSALRRRGARRPARAGPGSTGRRRSAPRRSPRVGRPALFDETSFAKLEVGGPGAVGVPPAHVRQRHRPCRSGRSSTRSCSTGAAGSRPT